MKPVHALRPQLAAPLFLPLAVVLVALYACVPDDDGCRPAGSHSCTCPDGTSRAQACIDGVLQPCVCGGPAPQTSRPTAGQACDEPGTLVCGTGSDGYKQAALSCPANGGAYVDKFHCPATQTCLNVKGDTEVACGLDSTSASAYRVFYAIAGDSCAAEQSAACNFDQSQVLQCQRGIWVVEDTCSGSGRCDVAPNGTVSGNRTCSVAAGCTMCTGGSSGGACPAIAIYSASGSCAGVRCGDGTCCDRGQTCSYQSGRYHCCN